MHIISFSLLYYSKCFHLSILNLNGLQVDLTQYVEKHEFVFDAVLDEEVTNDEVTSYNAAKCLVERINGQIYSPIYVTLFLMF